MAQQVANYIKRTNYEKVFLLENFEEWKGEMEASCRNICEKKGISLITVKTKKWNKTMAEKFANIVSEIILEGKKDD